MVRDVVPANRLLEYRVEEGWPTLCKFLEKDCPNEAFPNGNRKQELEARVQALTVAEIERLKGLAFRYSGVQAMKDTWCRYRPKATRMDGQRLCVSIAENNASSMSSGSPGLSDLA